MLRVLCLLVTAIFVLTYGVMTVQRIGNTREKMSDGANVLALRVQEKLSSLQGTSLYLSSLNSVNTMLVQPNPSLISLSDYDDIIRSVSGSDLMIELLFHKSQKILVSDYGLTDYEKYRDQAFLQTVLAQQERDAWVLRDYQQNIYVDSKRVLSYIRMLPLSSVQNNGLIVVSQSLSSIAKTAAANANPALGGYAVWLNGDMVLAASGDVNQTSDAQLCLSTVEIPVRAAYWMPLGTLLARCMPNPALALAIYAVAMLLCVAAARLISRERMARLDALVEEMGGEMEEELDDQVDQLYRIFEGLSEELTHAKQTTREGLPLLQERLIGELLRTRVPLCERRERLQKCGVMLPYPYFAVVQAAIETQNFDEQVYLLVQKQVQAQLSALGAVYSTYGDGTSILFLINAREYDRLGEELEKLCETLHDALQSFLQVTTVFAIGLCEKHSPSLNDAYVAARNRLLTVRMLDGQPQDAVTLAPAGQAYLNSEIVWHVRDAILSQDEKALQAAMADARQRYLVDELPLREMQKRAEVLLLRVSAELTGSDFAACGEGTSTVLKTWQQLKGAQDVRAAWENWCLGQISPATENAEESNRYVEETLQFIHENYMRTLNVPEIAEQVNINPIYLNRLFKSATGSTLSNYLSLYRCDHARRLLEETQMNINQISDACGFSEVRSFIRFFKKYYDQTPTEYRKQARN